MSLFDTLKKVFTGDNQPVSERHSPAEESKPVPSPEETYIAVIEAQRAEKDSYLRRDPYGPIEDRLNFTGLIYYPADPAFRYVLPLNRSEPEPLTFQTSKTKLTQKG